MFLLKKVSNHNIKPHDGKNWQNIFHITASKILYEWRHWLCLVSVTLWWWTQHNTISQFRKDKILINSRPLDKGQGQLCVSAESKVVSILMATKGGQGDSRCFWCTTQNDFHVLHSWQSITGRNCYANQSSSHICRDQGHRKSLDMIAMEWKGECIWLKQAKLNRYSMCTHCQTVATTDHNEDTQKRDNIHQTHTNSPWQTGGGPSICSLSPSRHVRISLPTKVKPGRHEYRIMSPVR